MDRAEDLIFLVLPGNVRSPPTALLIMQALVANSRWLISSAITRPVDVLWHVSGSRGRRLPRLAAPHLRAPRTV